MNFNLLALAFFGFYLVQIQCYIYYQGQNTPIIGIYTQPSRWKGMSNWDYDYIVSSYVRWLDQHGARIVPVPFSSDEKQLKEIFQQINGLLFTGGGLDLHKNVTAPHTNLNYNIFVSNAKKLMDWAKEANDQGNYFPVWGTCQGFELMLILENDLEHGIMTNVKNDINVSRSLIPKSLQEIQNSVIMKTIDQDALEYVSTHNSLFYYHEWAITEQSFNLSNAKNVYKIIAYSMNDTVGSSQNYKYISVIEGIKYPFYAVQFHPEYQQYDFFFDFDKDPLATKFSQQLALFFNQECRKNKNKYFNNSTLLDSLVYQVNPILNKPPELWSIYFLQTQYFPLSKFQIDQGQNTDLNQTIYWPFWIALGLSILSILINFYLFHVNRKIRNNLNGQYHSDSSNSIPLKNEN